MNEITEFLKSAFDSFMGTELPKLTLTNLVDVFKYSVETFISLAYKYIEIFF